MTVFNQTSEPESCAFSEPHSCSPTPFISKITTFGLTAYTRSHVIEYISAFHEVSWYDRYECIMGVLT